MVKNIHPAGSSNPSYLVNANGILFFSANNGTDGIELWKSDGTDNGTVLVKDINPSIGSSNPSYITYVDGAIFFVANDGIAGRELWRSDGTVSGTYLVRDITS